MTVKNLAEEIAQACYALRNCAVGQKNNWWEDRLTKWEHELLPSGSGFDSGTRILREKTGINKIVMETAFHHMNEHGMYDVWTHHIVRVRPTFLGLDITVSGPNRNDIKDYIAEIFVETLSQPVRKE